MSTVYSITRHKNHFEGKRYSHVLAKTHLCLLQFFPAVKLIFLDILKMDSQVHVQTLVLIYQEVAGRYDIPNLVKLQDLWPVIFFPKKSNMVEIDFVIGLH